MSDIGNRLSEIDPSGMAVYGSIVSLSPAAAISLGSMEGVIDTPAAPEKVAPPAPTAPTAKLGVTLAVAIAAIAYLVHSLNVWPFTVAGKHPVSSAIIAILIGVAIRNLFTLPKHTSIGTKLLVRKLIPIAIVCIGAGLDFSQIAKVGPMALVVMIVCVLMAYAASYTVGRLLGLSKKTSILLGVGTGICGSSAIVAASPLVDADEQDMVLSVGTVNLLGLVVMFALPAIAAATKMEAQTFGIWCGTTVHAVPQVLGAGGAHFSDPAVAVEWATVTKLSRVILLAPLIMILAFFSARQKNTSESTSNTQAPKIHFAKLVPWYIWGFILMAILNSAGWLPTVSVPIDSDGGSQSAPLAMAAALKQVGKLLLVVTLAGIGLEVHLKKLVGVGGKAICAGLISTALLAIASYALIYLVL